MANFLGPIETGEPILPQLRERQIFSIERTESGHFVLQEECDNYFDVELTPQDLKNLAAELVRLADDAISEKIEQYTFSTTTYYPKPGDIYVEFSTGRRYQVQDNYTFKAIED